MKHQACRSAAISATLIRAMNLSTYWITLLLGIGYHGDTTKFQFVGATAAHGFPYVPSGELSSTNGERFQLSSILVK